MIRTLALGALLLGAGSARAATVCVVDFQKSVTETEEGKSAQKRIDTMYSARKGELDRMQTELEKEIQDYQSRAMVLSAEARAEAEQKLALKQRSFEQTYMQYQGEMQQTYLTLLGDLDAKMRTIAKDLAKSKSCGVLLDSAVVVYAGEGTVDLSTELVAKYNATHKAQ